MPIPHHQLCAASGVPIKTGDPVQVIEDFPPTEQGALPQGTCELYRELYSAAHGLNLGEAPVKRVVTGLYDGSGGLTGARALIGKLDKGSGGTWTAPDRPGFPKTIHWAFVHGKIWAASVIAEEARLQLREQENGDEKLALRRARAPRDLQELLYFAGALKRVNLPVFPAWAAHVPEELDEEWKDGFLEAMQGLASITAAQAQDNASRWAADDELREEELEGNAQGAVSGGI